MRFKSIFMKILYGLVFFFLTVLDHLFFGRIVPDSVPNWFWQASEDILPTVLLSCAIYFHPFAQNKYLNSAIALLLAILGDAVYLFGFA